jgi:hypothetical protein
MWSGTPVRARVSSVVRGGLLVDIGYPVRAFLPASQVGVRRVPELSKFVGTTVTVLITEVDPRGPAVVVSRRRVLEQAQGVPDDANTVGQRPGPQADVASGTGRTVIDISDTHDFEEACQLVMAGVQQGRERGVDEILVRTGPRQKSRLRSRVASGGFEEVDRSQSRQVADGLVLVLRRQQPGVSSTP